MLNFIGRAFKGIMSFIIVILLILIVISGFVLLEQNPRLAILVWFIGLLTLILIFGFISVFLNIDTNLQSIVDHGFIISGDKIVIGGHSSETWLGEKIQDYATKELSSSKNSLKNNS